jgi:hypothetical protein
MNGSEVGPQQSHSALLNWPFSVEIQPSSDVQVIVYSPIHSPTDGVKTHCIPDISGVVSQLQVTWPKSMICAAFGSTLPRQLIDGIEKAKNDISHGCPMFTLPVAVAVHP